MYYIINSIIANKFYTYSNHTIKELLTMAIHTRITLYKNSSSHIKIYPNYIQTNNILPRFIANATIQCQYNHNKK